MDLKLTVFLLTLVVGGSAGPVRSGSGLSAATCSKSCTGSSKFGYTPGSSYEYKYEVETKTEVVGASDNQGTIGITAIAVVEVHSKCEMVLEVRDVNIHAYDSKQLRDQDEKKVFANTLQKYPLRFSFQDGVVESVCPHQKETTWAVNIKKGILSAFQLSLDSFETNSKGKESDVTGKCDTEYVVAQQGWRSLTIKKTKDLSTCTHRHDFLTAIQTTPFKLSSGLKNLPLLKGTHTCDHEVTTAGVLKSTVCHEMHVLQPFSKGNSGAATETTQKMLFFRTVNGLSTQQAATGDGEELYFRHDAEEEAQDEKSRTTLNLLKDMCQATKSHVHAETPRQFAGLVQSLKKLDFRNMLRVYNQAMKDDFCQENAERVRQFVMDGFPMVGTSASVELIKHLISNEEVKGEQADMWLASLAFIDQPNTYMIKEVLNLLGLKTLEARVILPLSSLVSSYCRINPQCADVDEVANFISILGVNLQGGCKVTQDNFRTVMMTLRGLGNTGHAETLTESLYTCAFNENNPMDIRVAAVQAFRKLSCEADRNNLMALFRNTDQDSELRIHAYLAIMKCPSQYIIAQIRQTLTEEEVNQVGSFVWSHLTNLMESSDPENKLVQGLLNGQVLEKDFDLSQLKFSRNYEASAFINRLNTGAKIDANTIWSTKSFIPRSASLNLTLDLFGEKINLFELGGRVEGLEHLLESYFGPLGHYSNKDEMSNEVPEYKPRLANISPEKLKSIQDKGRSKQDKLRGAMYMRMLDNELTYSMFGHDNGQEQGKAGSEVFNFIRKLMSNEPQTVSATKSFMFVDSKYVVPTIAGLPLTLAINGTATVALNVQSQLNLKNPAASVLIEGTIEPSGAVEIDSSMSVDAIVTKAGLKMVSTLHTSTGAKASIALTDMSVFDFKFDLTKEKSEIMSVKTNFFMIYNNDLKEQKMIQQNRYDNQVCSGKRLEAVTGLQLCAGLSAPNASHLEMAPYFPLTGPISINIDLLKTDLPNGYKLEAKVIKNRMQTLFRVLSDTPNSKEKRAIGLDVQVHAQSIVDINLDSPWKKATFKGELKNSAENKGLLGQLDVDQGARTYNLDANILIERTKDKLTYTPSITLSIPEWKNLWLNGSLSYVLEKSIDVDLQLTGAVDHPVTLKTLIINTDKQVGAKLNFNYEKGTGYEVVAMVEKKVEKSRHSYKPEVLVRTPTDTLMTANGDILFVVDKNLKAKVKVEKLTKIPITVSLDLTSTKSVKRKNNERHIGRCVIEGPKISSNLMLTLDNRADKNLFQKLRWSYSLWGNRDTIILNNKIKLNSNKLKEEVKVTSSLKTTKNSDYNADFTMTFITTKTSTELNANIKNKKTNHKLDFNFKSTHKLQGKKKTVDYIAGLQYPQKNVDVSIKGSHNHDGSTIQEEFSIKYHPEREVSINLRLHNKTSAFLNYAGELTIGLPEKRQMSFALGFGRESENKYISNLEFEIIKGRRTRIDSLLKIATHSLYEVEVGLQLPDLDPVRVSGSYSKKEKGFYAIASFKRGENLYRLSTDAMYDIGQAAKLDFDLTVPARRVKIILDSFRYKSLSHNMIDIQWDADKNLDDRFLINSTYNFKGWEDFDVSFTLHYPSRTIDFEIKHSINARYITSTRLSWSPTEQIEAKMIFRNDVIDISKRTELTISFNSPFKDYEELGLLMSLIRDQNQYQTKTSLTWAKKKKILVALTCKVPATLNSIDVSGTILTPFENYSSMTASITHRLAEKTLDSSLLIEWGRERISIAANGNVTFNVKTRRFNSKLDIRTPFEGLRIFSLTGEHADDLENFHSRLSAITTQTSNNPTPDSYLLEMKVEHKPSKLYQKGSLQITYPGEDIATDWLVSLETGRTEVLFDMRPMRASRVKVRFEETHQLSDVANTISASFESLVPSSILHVLFIKFEHQDRAGYMKNGLKITKDNLDVFSTDIHFTKIYGAVTFEAKIACVSIDDITLKLSTAYSISPYRGSFEARWSKKMAVTAVSRIHFDKFGTYDGNFELTTPLQMVPRLVVSTKHNRQGLNWEMESTVEYAPQQKISLYTTYRFDHVKLTSIRLTTPFPQFSKAAIRFNLEGTVINLKGDVSAEVLPYLPKTSANLTWEYYHGTKLSGRFNLNTPFPQYPYMKARLDSDVLGPSRVSSLEVEYLPTQIIKIQADHMHTSANTITGTVKVTSPFTQNQQVTAGFTHVGDRVEFKTSAKITCECWPKEVYADTAFSQRDGITSSFNMSSPFDGYEQVKWRFSHKGDINNFHNIAEYITRDDKLSVESKFKITDNIEAQFTLLTPFKNFTRSHLLFTHTGKLPNTFSRAEIALNEKTIVADARLSHNNYESDMNVVVTTPFTGYERISTSLKKIGTLNDFTAVGEYKYTQTWRAELKHFTKDFNIKSGVTLSVPYFQDDVKFSIEQVGTPFNFTSKVQYTMGTIYETTKVTEFLYDLPNLKASSTCTTHIKGETRVNAFIVKHVQEINDLGKYVNIESQVLAQLNTKKTGLEFKYNHDFESGNKQKDFKGSGRIDIVAELPIEGLEQSKLSVDIKNEANKHTSSVVFETPMLKKVTYNRDTEFGPFDSKDFKGRDFSKLAYGDKEITSEMTYRNNLYTHKITTPFEGYEHNNFVVKFSGLLFTNPEEIGLHPESSAIIDLDIISSALTSPVKISLQDNLVFDDTRTLQKWSGQMKMEYNGEVYNSEAVYTEGHYISKLMLPSLGKYSTSTLDLKYNVQPPSYELVISNTGMEQPIKSSAMYDVKSGYAISNIYWQLTTGFSNFTKVHFISKLDLSETSCKPEIILIWNNENEEEQRIEVSGASTLMIVDAANVDIGASLMIKTPFEILRDAEVSFRESHKSAPIRAESHVLAKLNSKKYLDVGADFVSLDKFVINVKVLAPRNMEYFFSSENEGESVKVDLLADWNKNEANSQFRLTFGLADTGDSSTEKKEFFVKVINPGRVISLNHNFKRSSKAIITDGMVSWSSDRDDVATYSLNWNQQDSKGTISHTARFLLTVPLRTIQMNSHYANGNGQVSAEGSVLWDAAKDRNKQIEVKVILSPRQPKYLAQVNVSMPSIEKDVSLTSELVLNDGERLVDGNVRLLYSPEANKAVQLQYIVSQSANLPKYKAGISFSHVETNTHLGLISMIETYPTRTVAEVNIQYLKNSNEQRTLNFSTELDTQKQQMKIQLATPQRSAMVSGHMTDQSPYELQVLGYHDNMPVWKTVWNVNNLKRTLDASLNYDQLRKRVVTHAMLVNDTYFTSRTESQSGSSVVEEGSVQGHLQGRLLHSRLTWRPELIQDVMAFGDATLQKITSEVGSVLEEGIKEVGDEMVFKFRTIRTSISAELSPLHATLEAELEEFEQDLRQVRRHLKKMYRNNELYLKDIDTLSEGTVKQIMQQYEASMQHVARLYSLVQTGLTELKNKLDTYPLQQKYTDFINNMSKAIENGQKVVVEEINRFLDEVSRKLEEMSTLYQDVVMEIRTDVEKYINALIEELMVTPYTDKLREVYNQLLNEYKDRLDLHQVHEMLNNVRELLSDSLKAATLSEKYTVLYTRSQQVLGDQFTDVFERQDIQEIKQSLQDLYLQVSLIYQYTRMNVSATDFLEMTANRIKEYLLQDFNQLPLGLLEMHKSRFTTFDLKKGEVEFDLYLPIPVENFDQLMQFTIQKYLGRLQQMQEKYFPRRDICLWDLYYSLPPVKWSLNKDGLIPPFDVYGTVSGHQHYTTFDGSHFDLAGLCSYILATDLDDGNFTVIQKYDGSLSNSQRDSLIVMLMGKMIELNVNYMVRIDGQPIEMPYQSPRLDIERRGNKVFLRSDVGLDIMSDFTNDYHIIKLSGWYFGKVGGLLGSYDNEPRNDQLVPGGKIKGRDAQFLESWEVDDSCRSQRNLADNSIKDPSELCSAMFDLSTSPMRPCFLQVPPAHFLHQCNDEPDNLCRVASLYIEMCLYKGISLSLPQQCMKCATSDRGSFLSNETMRYESQVSHDVVFVVEENHCNRDMANKLKEVIYRLEQSFTDSANNQYSLIGYDGSRVVSHTMEGQLFNDDKKFAMGLENLRFHDYGINNNLDAAIRHATTLPFRAGVQKTLILVSCSSCGIHDNLPDSGLKWELQQRGITLHVLQLSAFQLKTNRSPKALIYGIDGSKLYAAPRANTNSYEEIHIPEDKCSNLALSTNGSIFDGSQMLKDNMREQRAFIREFSSRVSSTEPSCQVCSCEQGSDGSPVTVCRRCDVKPLTLNFINKMYSTVKGYTNEMTNHARGLLF